MKCPYSVPLKGKFDVFGEPVHRPCGECAVCRRNKIMTVVNRGKYEYNKHKYSAFVTLTYDDNHLYYLNKPFGENKNVGLPSTCKKHVFTFLDDLRHYVKRHNLSNCDKDFSYMYSTEYGSDRARPHVHLALFGIDFPIAKKIATKLWKYGFVDSRPVISSTVKYIAKYINKGAHGKYADLQYHDKGVEKPVVKWSRGFGSGFYKEHADEIKKFGYIPSGNKKLFVPSYYKNKIVCNNMSSIFRSEIEKNFSREQKRALAVRYGFNSVDDFEKQSAINFCNNEFYKNINNKSSVDLEELHG